MNTKLLLLAYCFSVSALRGQTPGDTTIIKNVDVKVYFTKQPIIGLTSAAQALDAADIQEQQTTTLLPAMNRVAGLRLEERSPGSYRIALRGSTIRSPFGVRNTKIYLGDFPLTDAGGNTYLNLIDPLSLASILVVKGPDGSLFGANAAGVILLDPKGFSVQENKTELLLSSGAYGLFQEQLSVQQQVTAKYRFAVNQSFLRSDGYRANSAMNKKTFQTAHQWDYAPHRSLSLLALYSDLGYRTPGGLTSAQQQENPRMARPRAGSIPGAEEQKAGIYNKTFYGGIAHDMHLSEKLQHSLRIFGSITDFTNPFITNYEKRDEKNLGLRSYFSYNDVDRKELQWQMQLGFEGQKGWNKMQNFDNNKGQPAAMQASDKLDNGQYTAFYRAMLKLYHHWTMEGSLSWNTASVGYRQQYPVVNNSIGEIDFGSIWMPRLASSYRISPQFALRASVAKGYSPPTLAEVRASDNRINTDLGAEKGTNYEVGARLEGKKRRWMADVAYYSYKMKNGIIRQINEQGADYYLNAGVMDQKGLEGTLAAQLIPQRNIGLIRSLSYHGAIARQFYTFSSYKRGNVDFSGNQITAVPKWTAANNLSLTAAGGFSMHLMHHWVSRMPLNDANTIYAEKYNLLQAKVAYGLALNKRVKVELFVGADNLLNERYSLGNDINAFGNRFFNPAATRNYYGGLKVSL